MNMEKEAKEDQLGADDTDVHDEINIGLDADQFGPVDIEVEATSKGEKAKTLSPEEGIEQLRNQLKTEREAREEAESRLHSATQDNVRLRGEVKNSDLQTIVSAIDTVKNNQTIAKNALKQALSEGDVDAIADLQETIASNAVKLAQLDSGKEALESQTETSKSHGANTDPVEVLAAQLSPRSAAWVRKHPEFARNPQRYQAMIGAHNVAIGNGAAVDSDEYFKQIERVLDIKKAAPVLENFDPEADAAQIVQRRTSPSPAPVGRSTVVQPEERRTSVVRLSAAEREMASNLGMTDEDYAKHKRDLIREGRIN